MAPTVTHESATLNTGHHPTATKSTTWPRRNPGRAQEPIREIAERAAEHERERDHEHAIRGAAQHAHEHDRDDDRADRQDRRHALEATECTAAVPGQAELDRVADQLLRAVGEVGDGPGLRGLVDHDDRHDADDDPTRSAHRFGRRGHARVSIDLRSTAPLAAGLALDALDRPREHLEPRQRDAIAARDAHAERVLRHLTQRAFDVLDGLSRGRREREVTLALDVDRVALARLLVELRVALLAFAREQVGLGRELVGLAEVAGPLGLESLAELLERARRQGRRQLLLGRRLRRRRRLTAAPP